MQRLLAPLLLASLVGSLACARAQEDEAKAARAAERTEREEAPGWGNQPGTERQPAGFSGSELGDVSRLFGDYDDLRDALARGDASDAVHQAQLLEKSASGPSDSAPAHLRPMLSDIARGAAAVRLAKNDIGAMRTAFQDVSRATIALLEAQPGLVGGRRVYVCEQVQGFNRWIAPPTTQTMNPYLGAAGSACVREAGTPGTPASR